MTSAQSPIHFAFVSLYLGQFVVLFIRRRRLRQKEQIAACLSRFLWQVMEQGHLGVRIG